MYSMRWVTECFDRFRGVGGQFEDLPGSGKMGVDAGVARSWRSRSLSTPIRWFHGRLPHDEQNPLKRRNQYCWRPGSPWDEFLRSLRLFPPPTTGEVINSGADQAAFCFAHLARWAAAIFARASGLIVFLFFGALPTDSAGEVEAAFFFAHLAFCAAAIFARAAADRLPFLPSTDFGLTCGTVPL